jgi:hypothetical protein
MDLKTSNEAGYLRAVGRGEFVLREAEKQFMDLLDRVVQTGAERVLFDGREVTGEPDAIERYFYGDFVAQATTRLPRSAVPKPPKFAYVLQEPVLDANRLGETVARNRGMAMRAFDNEQQAIAWLMSDER